jgi:CRISPR system Cascade subunit CasB
MSAFIERLESLNKKDTKVRAVLKRSLAFDPGTFPASYPYVEPFVQADGHVREMHYLVAGLWAAHWRDECTGNPMNFGMAAARHRLETDSSSLERRFIALIDADEDQLPHRLRQMMALLQEQPLDFGALLEDLLRWNNPNKRTQNQWARDFYHSQEPTTSIPESTSAKEPKP